MNAEKIWLDVELIRSKAPLVHNITNYVVMNTTANALLAIGASPVMAHAMEEVEEMVGIAGAVGGALVINIGTLSEQWINAMSLAMKSASQQSVPIVFDPVGAGATNLRTETCKNLLGETNPSIIRGNASEIMALLDSSISTKGVDSSQITDIAIESAKALAEQYKCTVSVSGEIDVITNGETAFKVKNGHSMMTKVTGLGCTASSITGAFAAVNSNTLEAATHAMAVMGICGEIAVKKSNGPGTLQLNLYDAFYNLSKAQIQKYLK